MIVSTTEPNCDFSLHFGEPTARWSSLVLDFDKALKASKGQDYSKYKQSRKIVQTYFAENPLQLPKPILDDEDAKDILNTVFQVEQSVIDEQPKMEEWYRRIGRHIREYLADFLLEQHLEFLRSCMTDGKNGLKRLIDLWGFEVQTSQKSLEKFQFKLNFYLKNQSFVRLNELTLSSSKIDARSQARAERGNLWHIERREKYLYLENLADDNKVCPMYFESDLEFLVSQSSLEMLKKKAGLLLKELGYVEPNRMKANLARLSEQLKRNKQRYMDFKSRKELLKKLGATPEQIKYISARATYQTMQNLLKLSNGKIAISDLMGGKRTINKLLRRNGKVNSEAEESIAQYLIEHEGVSPKIAEQYARTRKNHSITHLRKTLRFLKNNFIRIYQEQWGFEIKINVLRKAVEFSLSRQKLNKRSLSKKDFIRDLRKAAAITETAFVRENNDISATERRLALNPLREVLDYETDTDTRKQLFFIYEQFCEHGLCMPKDQLRQNCLKNKSLFPSPRKVQDVLEILNGAYRAIGQHGETVCILPDYLKTQVLTHSRN